MKRSKYADKSEIVVRRWFDALDKLIEQGRVKNNFSFSKQYNIPRQVLDMLRKEPARKFEPYYFTILVDDFGVSAHWLVTGRGSMGI